MNDSREFADETAESLYKIVSSKLASLRNCSENEWLAVMKEAGIVRTFIGETGHDQPGSFFRIADPFSEVTMLDLSRKVRLNRGVLHIPDELATKMLVLGAMP